MTCLRDDDIPFEAGGLCSDAFAHATVRMSFFQIPQTTATGHENCPLLATTRDDCSCMLVVPYLAMVAASEFALCVSKYSSSAIIE